MTPDIQNDRELTLSEKERAQLLMDNAFADQLFDSLLPEKYRTVSNSQWTSARVVEQIAQLLINHVTDLSTMKFIDIGSGVGKLCLLLAFRMTETKMKIFGIEQRKSLAQIAERIRRANHLENVQFAHRNMLELTWENYDIYYLYNPFQEHIVETGGNQIDHEIAFDRNFHSHYITEVFRQLSWADKGKKLITFHGYGEMVPNSWTLLSSQVIEKGSLCLWEKTK